MGSTALYRYLAYESRALRGRCQNGTACSVETKPALRCTANVITLATVLKKKNGAFSKIKEPYMDVPCVRFRGQKSINNSTKGSVTSIGFAINPSPNHTKARNRYRRQVDFT